MHHIFFPALALPLLFIACNARVVPGDGTGNGEESSSNADSGTRKAGDAGDTGPGCGPTDAGAGDAHPGDAGLTGACGEPDGTLYTFVSPADVLAHLRWRWLTCSGFIHQPADAVGIEFEGSRAWFLVEGANAHVVRGVGADYERSVTVLDDISMNGPGPYRFQVDLTSQSGSLDSYFLDLFENPGKLVLNEATSGNVAVYLPGPAPLAGTDAGVFDGGDDEAGFGWDGGIPIDSGDDTDGGVQTDGGLAGDGGTAVSSCSLVGTWDVTSNIPFGNLSSFLFSSNGTFIGGPRSASLPTGETFSGDWSIAPDGEVSISNTTGMLCNQGSTNMSLTYRADCGTVTLQVVTDACTGAREQLDDTTVLVRR